MILKKLFKNRKISEPIHFQENIDKIKLNELEDSISKIANKEKCDDFDLDSFLENFFKIDKYFILEVSKLPSNNKYYIEMIDDKLSTVIFTSRKKANQYLNRELKSIESGKDGNIIITQRKPEDVFGLIEDLKDINVDRILFNYPTEWVSFNIK